MPELLTVELLERLDRMLRDVGAAIVDHWQPGLTREQMDAITEPQGFSLPDEAALWWGWHNGSGTAELMPTRRVGGLEVVMAGFELWDSVASEVWGLTGLVAVVNEQPWLWFHCRG